MAQLEEDNHVGDDLELFGDDDEQQYNDAAELDDILGLDENEDAPADTISTDPEGSLLMRFCPHDSSMLYPKVRWQFIIICVFNIN